MTPHPLVFVDTETTSLRRAFRPAPRRAWEIALIVRHSGAPPEHDRELVWRVDVDVADADPAALDVGGWHERHDQPPVYGEAAVAEAVAASVPHGAVLVGANPGFDEEVLADLLYRHGHLPTWHFRLRDVESAAAAVYRVVDNASWGLQRLAGCAGIDTSGYAAHTALDDARLARDLHDKLWTGR